MDEEKPPPRMCPRCNSDNIRFCYYNNYSLSQPRYTCKNCRRLWTHGGTLRNIPICGSGRKNKRPRIDQPSVPQVVPVETQQVNHHQSFLHDQETNDILGSIGGSSSYATASAIVGNHAGSSDLIGNPLTNQSIGGHVNNYNSYSVNQEDPKKPKQNFNTTMGMNNNASKQRKIGH